MKRKYEKPVFIAEAYVFNESIATCGIHANDPDAAVIKVNLGDSLCPVGDGGHRAGKNNANIKNYPVTIFNSDKCSYKWNGTQNFGKDFYGATANNDNHRPAYKGQTFLS